MKLIFSLNSNIRDPFEPTELRARLIVGGEITDDLVFRGTTTEPDPNHYQATARLTPLPDPNVDDETTAGLGTRAGPPVSLNPYDPHSHPQLALSISALIPGLSCNDAGAIQWNLMRMISLGRRDADPN